MLAGGGLAVLIAAAAAQLTVPVPPAPPADAHAPAEAWVRFDANGPHASGTAGVVNKAYPRAVTIEDRPRIASISKLAVALGVMRLVEQKKLDLNRDVSDYLGWRLRNPAFPDQQITLAMLLSHTSSLRDNGEGYLIPLGETVETALARAEMWDSAHGPRAAYFAYGNINFPVVGSIIEKVTGQRFDKAMDALVIKPLGMRACFNLGGGCTDRDMQRIVTLYRPNGDVARDDLGGRLPACPVFVKEGARDCDLSTYTLGSNGALFSPQGGLRISPKELAEIGRMLARRGLAADGSRFLSARSVAAMERPRWRYDGRNGVTESGVYCTYGLAVHILGANRHPGCRDRLPGQSGIWYGHSGDAYSLRSGLWYDPRKRTGMAYYVTQTSDGAPETGPSGFTLSEQRMAAKR